MAKNQQTVKVADGVSAVYDAKAGQLYIVIDCNRTYGYTGGGKVGIAKLTGGFKGLEFPGNVKMYGNATFAREAANDTEKAEGEAHKAEKKAEKRAKREATVTREFKGAKGTKTRKGSKKTVPTDNVTVADLMNLIRSKLQG